MEQSSVRLYQNFRRRFNHFIFSADPWILHHFTALSAIDQDDYL
jgi:hypothetical protein